MFVLATLEIRRRYVFKIVVRQMTAGISIVTDYKEFVSISRSDLVDGSVSVEIANGRDVPEPIIGGSLNQDEDNQNTDEDQC